MFLVLFLRAYLRTACFTIGTALLIIHEFTIKKSINVILVSWKVWPCRSCHEWLFMILEWMNEWMNEWINGWMNEWINEWCFWPPSKEWEIETTNSASHLELLSGLPLSNLSLPLSSSSTTSGELLSQFSTCSEGRWLEFVYSCKKNISLL